MLGAASRPETGCVAGSRLRWRAEAAYEELISPSRISLRRHENIHHSQLEHYKITVSSVSALYWSINEREEKPSAA